MPRSTNVKYSNDDLDALHRDDRTRTVLTTIAAQTGIITNPELTLTDDEDGDGDGRDREGTTVSNIRAATGLKNTEVNYELRKLKGNTTEQFTTQLIETRQQGTDETGRQLPKLVWLTDAAEQLFEHDVLNTEGLTITTTPDWLPSDTTTDAQIEAIANRLDHHETVLDELMHHIGFTAFTDLITTDAVTTQPNSPEPPVFTRDTIVANPARAEQFVQADAYSLLTALERIRLGQSAMKQALETELNVDPSNYVEQ